MLIAAPTGISWSSIGAPTGKPTLAQQYDEIVNICGRATAMVNGFCNVPLRATIDVEQLTGPGDFRFQIQPNGRSRLLMSRPPIVAVLGGRVTPAAAFPATWTDVPADQFRVEFPLIGVYGSSSPNGSGDGGHAILMAPGVVNWSFGRMAYDLQVTYLNGWPHCSTIDSSAAGATTIRVDDITGWLNATGVLHDVGNQESARVTAVTPDVTGDISGPGELTLHRALTNNHPIGVIFTTLPGTVVQATLMFAVSQALIRGATATTVQALSGSRSSSGSRGPDELIKEAKLMLQNYRRVI